MKESYLPVSQNDTSTPGEAEFVPTPSKPTLFPWLRYLILLLLTTNAVTFFLLFKPSNSDHTFSLEASPLHEKELLPLDYARTEPINIVWTRFDWWTAYSTESEGYNHTEQDILWDAILPSHGFVAMDRDWAAVQNWPVSMRLPSDPSKGVYLLEAYHQLHCLRMIRKTFWEAVFHKPYTYTPSVHMAHCFDTLRQAIVCNADNTPLYTFGDNTAGDGQLHRCRSWADLRDFASAHTACYRDTIEDVPLKDHFGFCDEGTDGMSLDL